MKRRTFVTSALGIAAATSIPCTRVSAADLPAKTLSGGETMLSDAELKEFGESLRGPLLRPRRFLWWQQTGQEVTLPMVPARASVGHLFNGACQSFRRSPYQC